MEWIEESFEAEVIDYQEAIRPLLVVIMIMGIALLAASTIILYMSFVIPPRTGP